MQLCKYWFSWPSHRSASKLSCAFQFLLAASPIQRKDKPGWTQKVVEHLYAYLSCTAVSSQYIYKPNHTKSLIYVWSSVGAATELQATRNTDWEGGQLDLYCFSWILNCFKIVLSFHIHCAMGVMPQCCALVLTRLFSLPSAIFVLYCSVCSLCPWIYFAFVSLASVSVSHNSSNNSSAWLMIEFVVQRSQDVLYQEGL